ncbi:MAG TPA: pyridoxamine 5'-phosphate oxidase family protein [Acidimicrobiales bacterium]|nr:pyridoxamine 5'-phosphate oxidase family protein [Acidimicrobiales bacterium]
MDRVGIEILSFDQCRELLEGAIVGRIGMVVNGEPVILPVNYRYVRGSIVFRTALGEKSDAAVMGKPVAFEIDDWDPVHETGWSVLVKGTAHEVDADDAAAADASTLQPWARAVERDIWVRIVPNEITGRRVA